MRYGIQKISVYSENKQNDYRSAYEDRKRLELVVEALKQANVALKYAGIKPSDASLAAIAEVERNYEK